MCGHRQGPEMRLARAQGLGWGEWDQDEIGSWVRERWRLGASRTPKDILGLQERKGSSGRGTVKESQGGRSCVRSQRRLTEVWVNPEG
jgi:hypothetical protein